jgi:hypothetical protein
MQTMDHLFRLRQFTVQSFGGKAGFGCVLCMLALAMNGSIAAEEATKSEEKKPPQILVGMPLGFVKGETNRMVLRGLNLETVDKVSTAGNLGSVQIVLINKGKSDPPKNEAKEEVGDTQLRIEVFPPLEFEGCELEIQVQDTEGAISKWIAPVFSGDVLLIEREANDHLKHAKKIPTEAVVLGCIQTPKDVDVYEFYAVAGHSVILEVNAARYGSPMDPLLMLYDESAHVLKVDDDSGGKRDARMTWTPTLGGFYRAAVLDANDKGGAMHGYIFSVRPTAEIHP